MPQDPTDFDFDTFLSTPFHERPRPRLTSERRPDATPRVVSVLQQQAYQYKKEHKITLTAAKNAIATEYGFESWQHLKNLSLVHAAIKPKTLEAVGEDFEIKTDIKIRLDFEETSKDENDPEDSDDEDGPWITFEALYKRAFENGNPPTEAVYFNIDLTLVSKIDQSSKVIGYVSGYMYFDNERNSLFDAFDAQDGDAGGFSESFQFAFDKSLTDDIFNLAYIETLFVEEEFDESAFGSVLLKACRYNLDGLADAIFSEASPIAAFPNPQNLSYHWDNGRERTKNLIATYEHCGFKKIAGSAYLVWDIANWDEEYDTLVEL